MANTPLYTYNYVVTFDIEAQKKRQMLRFIWFLLVTIYIILNKQRKR
jgi:hypothetical protein